MEMFQLWLMPEEKIKGSYDKWELQENVIESKNRKHTAEELSKTYKSGMWKLRKV